MIEPAKRDLVLRNCRTNFYGDEILAESTKFTRAYFASVREGGYTGIWLRGQLRQLVTFDEAPHWDHRTAERRDALNHIIRTARASGIDVFLYVNEPKGFSEGDPIFAIHPELKGPVNPLALRPQASGNQPKYAFCTCSEFTDTYLRDGFRRLFTACPDIAGVISITTSEILSHCFSNVDEMNLMNEDFKYREVLCPHCREVGSIATIVDVISKIRSGIREAGSEAKVVAWNWSWGMHEPSPQPRLISALPSDVIVMSDLQRAGHKSVDGFDIFVDEYSFSYLGPSPLFLGTAEIAKSQGRGLWTKMPVNVTHEFLVCAYLPLFFRLARKTIALRDLHSTGLMGCWNYNGEATTPMARLASTILRDDSFDTGRIEPEVRRIAAELYGPGRAQAAYQAWTHYDAAFEYFPFEVPFIYYGPHMHGPGFEWVFTREEITMPEYYLNRAARRGTKLSDCCVRFTPQENSQLLGKLTDGWEDGVRTLAAAWSIAEPFDAISDFEELSRESGFEDFCIGRTVAIHFRSTLAFFRFRQATLTYFEREEDRDLQKAIILGLFEEEKPRIRAMGQIIQAYPHIPFADEACKALYTPGDLEQKLQNMDAFCFEEGQSI